jgi:hypothetical protein
MSNTFSLEDGSVYEEMWKTLIETDRQDTDDNITRHIKVAMCVSDIEVKNTDTQSFNTYCFIIDSICLIA